MDSLYHETDINPEPKYDLVKFLLPADFINERVLLSPTELAFGLSRGWVSPESVIRVATHQLAAGGCISKPIEDLALLLDDQADEVADILSSVPVDDLNKASRVWVFLVVSWVTLHRDRLDAVFSKLHQNGVDDIWDVICAIFEDFGSPREIASLVKWMPVLPDEEVGLDAMELKLARYIESKTKEYAARREETCAGEFSSVTFPAVSDDHVCVELQQVLRALPEHEYCWAVVGPIDCFGTRWIPGGRTWQEFSRIVEQHGLFLSWDELVAFAENLGQAVDICIVGAGYQSTLEKTVSMGLDFSACDVTIEARDSTDWCVRFAKESSRLTFSNNLASMLPSLRIRQVIEKASAPWVDDRQLGDVCEIGGIAGGQNQIVGEGDGGD